jgi:MFS family permease
VELVPQSGDFALAKHLDSQVIRVHSISEAEMADQMTPARALERFALAVKERKVRVCYVRLFFNQGEPWAANQQYLTDVVQTVRAAGCTLGEPQIYTTPHLTGPVSGRLVHIALYLAIGAAALWLLQVCCGLSLSWFWGLFGLMALSALVQGLAGKAFSADLATFLAAAIFPAAGILLLRRPERPDPQPVRRAVLAFLAISGLTLAGGLLIAACLTDLTHLMSVSQFRGVKAAEVLPLLLVGLVALGRAMPRYEETRLELGEQGEVWSLREGLAQALNFAVRYWHALLILVLMVVVGVLLIRSGNDSPVAPTGAERAFRDLLDHLLWVRPRTKEIFFGHPLLLLSLILFYRGQKRGVWLGLALGTIGQISILNTFCHLHTPILISLVRSFNGLWVGLLVGLVVGLVVWAIVRRYLDAKTRPATP